MAGKPTKGQKSERARALARLLRTKANTDPPLATHGAGLEFTEQVINEAHAVLPTPDPYWLSALDRCGPPAVLEAMAMLVEMGSLPADVNPISALTKLLSNAFRRRLLLESLELYEWNLSAVARELRMGAESSPILRLIRELDLEEEYQQAKERLGIVAGGHRLPVPDRTKKP